MQSSLKIIFLFFLLFPNGSNAESCTSDGDCQIYNDCVNKSCEHKDLFPLGDLEIVGTVFIILISALSNASGVGGGALNVLISLLFFGFDTFSAVPLSQVIVLGGSLTTIILQIPLRHPTKDRPRIDYQLIMFIISPLLLGSTVGVILNKGFPEWLTLALLTVLLIYLSINSIKRFLKIYKEENKLRLIRKESNLQENEPEMKIEQIIVMKESCIFDMEELQNAIPTEQIEMNYLENRKVDQANNEINENNKFELKEIYRREKQMIP